MTARNRDFRILVVDDDQAIRGFMQDFCAVNGYAGDFAKDGFDALRILTEKGPFGLVIVDFLMPRMHGIEFMKEIRKHRADLPVIAMSAWPGVESSFIAAGATRFFAKPFDPCDLERAIEEILSEPRENERQHA